MIPRDTSSFAARPIPVTTKFLGNGVHFIINDHFFVLFNLQLVWGWLPFIVNQEKPINNNNTQQKIKSTSISLYQLVWNFTRSF